MSGRLNDSRKYRLCARGVPLDLYYLYRDDARQKTYTPGLHAKKHQEVRWYYPQLKGICAADLLNRLFYVPCNALEFVEAEYGADWQLDRDTSTYVWDDSGRNVERGHIYSDEEWSKVYQNNDAPCR
ncbi:fukutin [Aphelenchoides avenae]|nr:fukutin [Aphelenchus avenae]